LVILRKYANRELTWDSLSISDKLALFKKWYIVAFLGDLCIICGTLFFLGSDIYHLKLAELLIGFGTFLIWVSIVKYF
jgi:hypothetical protein